MKNFFDIAYKALELEEIALNKLFNDNKEYYDKHHHGIAFLYETTFVYIIFKALLKNKYPYRVEWEYPYPNNKSLHSDLALIDIQDKQPISLVEFKLWQTDKDTIIKKDIQKLKTESGVKKYIFIIGYGGDLDENCEYLMEENAGNIKIVEKKTLITKFFSSKDGKLINNNLQIILIEVL